MDWRHCPSAPLRWIDLREFLLSILNSPPLFLPFLAFVIALLAYTLRLSRLWTFALSLTFPLVASLIYTPFATSLLTTWLMQQVPHPLSRSTEVPVVVLVGRGHAIAAATTSTAAALLHEGKAQDIYVSGDSISTAQRLFQLGVSPGRISGDSCARTTWENARLTSIWLRQHHPEAPVLLVTDPWQLSRAARAFQNRGLTVMAVSSEPDLSAAQKNRLALRETAATLLYSLQGRI